MLILVTSVSEKGHAQEALRRTLESALSPQGSRRVGFRVGAGDTNPDMPLFSNDRGKLWFASASLPNTTAPRYWNAFGLFEPSRLAQEISVELNIPIDTNSKQVAAFFARDPETGRVYLLHSGRVGGGRKGIGKSAFLTWSGLFPVQVAGRDGHERFGINLGDPTNSSIVTTIDAYVKKVADFKKQVIEKTLDNSKFRQRVAIFNSNMDTIDRVNHEFSGRKTGQRRSKVIDYVSRHGDIVNALHNKLKGDAPSDEDVFNSPLVDLFVKRNRKTVAIYEVKTGTGRQAIYTAIGQLMVHAEGAQNIRKILVLPAEERLPDSVYNTLSSAGIEILGFALHDNGSCEFRGQPSPRSSV